MQPLPSAAPPPVVDDLTRRMHARAAELAAVKAAKSPAQRAAEKANARPAIHEAWAFGCRVAAAQARAAGDVDAARKLAAEAARSTRAAHTARRALTLG